MEIARYDLIKLLINMKILAMLLLVQVALPMKSQEKEESPINFSLGIGPNYGLIGLKTVLGENHSGLLIGSGVVNGKVSLNAGFQLAMKSLYFSACYGDIGVTEDHTGIYFTRGISINLGLNKDLSKTRPLFMTFGLGITFPGYPRPINYDYDYLVNVAAGIGYRFNLKPKRKTENPKYLEV